MQILRKNYIKMEKDCNLLCYVTYYAIQNFKIFFIISKL